MGWFGGDGWRAPLMAAFLLLNVTIATAARADDSGATALPAGIQIHGYVGEDVMIPMRDGVRLHAQIWRPAGASGEALPILLQRSPYGFQVERLKRAFESDYSALASERFIFLFQDIRGRFGSEGEFVMLRPKASAGGTDESSDTYDTIEWATKHIAGNNGAVGVSGISYGGWTAAMATINPHPALKAISVQASPEDMFVGDDFHRNGAFRLDYGWEYSAALETDGRTLKVFDFGADDPYAWFLKQPTLHDLDQRQLGKRLPTWQNFVRHPDNDAFWRETVTSERMPKAVAIPNLIVAGWWDQEDFYGPMKIYERQEAGDTNTRNFLVIGPWNHGGWARGDGRHYGPLDLGSDTATYFREQVERRWFRYWLKGQGSLDQPEALVFQTGSNTWKQYAAWPPVADVTSRKLYLRAGGRLTFTPPDRKEASDTFRSDPADPVPYRARPITPVISATSTWPQWLADDQSAFASRKDVLVWQTEPLAADLTISGHVLAKLFAATTGSDADWVVKLLDVYPSDANTPAPMRARQVMVANNVLRGRYRQGFETPQPITPNAVLPYDIDLNAAAHVFRKGHRIAVQVQSSWFPLIDRNPQTFVRNIFEARPEDFKAQTHTVAHDARFPSAITVSVEGEGPLP